MSTRSAPRSSSYPASVQPAVPLVSANTLGMPILCSTRAPMMLRVRPAQLTMIAASCSRPSAMSVMRRGSSPPGMLRPPGMAKRWYSSGVRESRITVGRPSSSLAWSSSALMLATWSWISIRSPKSLLGTFMPHSVGNSAFTHALMPPSRTDTLL